MSQPGPLGNQPMVLSECPTPEPGPDEVQVRVSVCGICRTDLHVVEGDIAPRRDRVIPGHQIVGEVSALGMDVEDLALGQRVGIAWLHHTCGHCRFCGSGRENLCNEPEFTGWSVDGGFAEYTVAPAEFCYALPDDFTDLDAAPLLCAGIIGYRALRACGLGEGASSYGTRLGIYGFGAAGHVAIQVALARGMEVYVATRDRMRQALALELGAAWVGDADEGMPEQMDASVVFAPAGNLVPPALDSLEKGGRLVLAGIHMSEIPSLPYQALYGERSVCTVANNTREDGRLFLEEAARIPVRTRVEEFAFGLADEALAALRRGAVTGAAVLRVR